MEHGVPVCGGQGARRPLIKYTSSRACPPACRAKRQQPTWPPFTSVPGLRPWPALRAGTDRAGLHGQGLWPSPQVPSQSPCFCQVIPWAGNEGGGAASSVRQRQLLQLPLQQPALHGCSLPVTSSQKDPCPQLPAATSSTPDTCVLLVSPFQPWQTYTPPGKQYLTGDTLPKRQPTCLPARLSSARLLGCPKGAGKAVGEGPRPRRPHWQLPESRKALCWPA